MPRLTCCPHNQFATVSIDKQWMLHCPPNPRVEYDPFATLPPYHYSQPIGGSDGTQGCSITWSSPQVRDELVISPGTRVSGMAAQGSNDDNPTLSKSSNDDGPTSGKSSNEDNLTPAKGSNDNLTSAKAKQKGKKVHQLPSSHGPKGKSGERGNNTPIGHNRWNLLLVNLPMSQMVETPPSVSESDHYIKGSSHMEGNTHQAKPRWHSHQVHPSHPGPMFPLTTKPRMEEQHEVRAQASFNQCPGHTADKPDVRGEKHQRSESHPTSILPHFWCSCNHPSYSSSISTPT